MAVNSTMRNAILWYVSFHKTSHHRRRVSNNKISVTDLTKSGVVESSNTVVRIQISKLLLAKDEP